MAERLRNHSVGVDGLDYTQHLLRLVLTCQHHEHVHFGFALPSLALHERYAAAHVRIDAVGNLLILL